MIVKCKLWHFELTTPLNECTGKLSRVSTRHKQNRRGMQKKKKKKGIKDRIMRKRNTVIVKCKFWHFEIITPLNECTGRLSMVYTRHKHNRCGMQKKV